MSDEFPEIDFDRLLQVFMEEARESLDALDEALLALSEAPTDSGALAEAFRRLHTLKGDAGTVGLPHLASFLHRLEDLFDTARREGLGVTARAVALMLDASDLLREMIAVAPEQLPAHRERMTEIGRRLDGAGELLLVRSAAADEGAHAGGGRVDSNLRVPIEQLDALVDLVGELAVARTLFGLRLADPAAPRAELVEMHREADRRFLGLQETVLRLRMVPVGRALQRYRRLVRQLAEQLGKRVRLHVEGGEVDVDAGVVARLIDPLSHLLRNAIDHGIEPPEERRALGKSEVGVVEIEVSQEPGHVVVRVTDDGRGLDRERLVAKARQIGAIRRAPTTPEEIDRLVFLSGLSTADRLSQVSGRGVGMDVVQQQVESLRGTVAVHNRPGAGTSFTLRLPLSLAVIDGFHVEVGGDTYVLPIESVVAATELAEDLATESSGLLSWRGQTLPFLRLRDAFDFPVLAPARQIAVIVDEGEGRRAALVVDRVLGQEPAVVKALAGAFDTARGFAGATVLNDGRVALVLQPAVLIDSLLARSRPVISSHPFSGGIS
ncbi:MAG TPA: chemotaxis protein CheA [Acidobacteria bacterium]|nr:chemotaxis protein CheA [Acidobacteriota bacterium]